MKMKMSFIAFISILGFAILGACADAAQIGVNNGMMGSNLPPAAEVLTLLKNNNIGKYRTFAPEVTILRAFANSGIEIIVGVPNTDLQSIASNQSAANKWVDDNIKPFYPAANVKYIAVGNELLGKSDTAKFLVSAMNNIQTALQNAALQSNIKVSTTHAATDIIRRFAPQTPSNGTFPDSIRETMTSVLQFLQDHSSPFMATVYPYFTYDSDRDSYNLNYTLFKSGAPTMTDGSLTYTNLFDAMVDTIYSSMEALGFSDIPIMVAESGWPSYGVNEKASIATIDNARTYNNNLIRHVLSTAGTPKRPGRSTETYIFALFNEDLKTGDETEKHYGLFYPNKTRVYDVNFSH